MTEAITEEERQKLKKKDEAEDLEFKAMLEHISQANKKLDESYDEKMRSLEQKKKLELDEREQEERQRKVSLLKERLAEIKVKISNARREGKDPFMAELILKPVKAKIAMLEATGELQDYEVANTILAKAESELDEALAIVELNVKKELEKRMEEERAKVLDS